MAAAAKGTVILTTNAEGMVRGLDQAKAKVNKFGKDTHAALNKAGEMLGGGGGGSFGRLWGAGFFGGIVGAVFVKSLNKVTETLGEWWSETAKWTQELDRAQVKAAELGKELGRSLRRRDEHIDAEVDPAKRGKLIWGDIGDMKARVAEQNAIAEDARKKLERLEGHIPTNIGAAIWGELGKQKAFATQQLNEAKAAAAMFGDRLAALQEQAYKIGQPWTDGKLKGDINRLTDSFREQRETLRMTSDEAKVFALERRGATAAMLAEARAEASLLQEARNAIEIAKGPRFAGAVEAGSREAYTLTLRNKFAEQGKAADPVAARLDQTNRLLQTVIRLLPQLATGTV